MTTIIGWAVDFLVQGSPAHYLYVVAGAILGLEWWLGRTDAVAANSTIALVAGLLETVLRLVPGVGPVLSTVAARIARPAGPGASSNADDPPPPPVTSAPGLYQARRTPRGPAFVALAALFSGRIAHADAPAVGPVQLYLSDRAVVADLVTKTAASSPSSSAISAASSPSSSPPPAPTLSAQQLCVTVPVFSDKEKQILSYVGLALGGLTAITLSSMQAWSAIQQASGKP